MRWQIQKSFRGGEDTGGSQASFWGEKGALVLRVLVTLSSSCCLPGSCEGVGSSGSLPGVLSAWAGGLPCSQPFAPPLSVRPGFPCPPSQPFRHPVQSRTSPLPDSPPPPLPLAPAPEFCPPLSRPCVSFGRSREVVRGDSCPSVQADHLCLNKYFLPLRPPIPSPRARDPIFPASLQRHLADSVSNEV